MPGYISLIKIATLLLVLVFSAGLPETVPTSAPGQEAWSDSGAMFDPTLRPARRNPAAPSLPFEAGPAPFPLRVRGDLVPLQVFFLPVLPGEDIALELELEPGSRSGADPPLLTVGAGTVSASDETGWVWTAPSEPGSYAIRVSRGGSAGEVFLNIFVLHPRSLVRSGRLNGYPIGSYQQTPLRGDSVYLPPPGFIEVRPEDEDILVSPHFHLGQFLCKEPGNPKYLALSRYLVAKLEVILEETNLAGYPASTFHVMSGFRTPAYNLAIGNQTVYSRHLWGGAADIFLDMDGDGTMDDLDGDGHSTIDDARILQEIANRVDLSEYPGTRPGGLGSYRRNAVRGPFIHVDARGRPARW